MPGRESAIHDHIGQIFASQKYVWCKNPQFNSELATAAGPLMSDWKFASQIQSAWLHSGQGRERPFSKLVRAIDGWEIYVQKTFGKLQGVQDGLDKFWQSGNSTSTVQRCILEKNILKIKSNQEKAQSSTHHGLGSDWRLINCYSCEAKEWEHQHVWGLEYHPSFLPFLAPQKVSLFIGHSALLYSLFCSNEPM